MMTEKVNRVEVIDHTKSFEEGGGRAFTFFGDEKKVVVWCDIQDDGRTLKVFIQPK